MSGAVLIFKNFCPPFVLYVTIMATLYCTRAIEYTPDVFEDLLKNVDALRVSGKTARLAKGGEVYVYAYKDTTKGKIINTMTCTV